MDNRRDFFKKIATMTGGIGLANALMPAIERAAAITAPPESTYLDAEHVVILMQENRSFDHCFGTLRGVRGFRDNRAVTLPDGNPVWLQTNAAGQTYAPFRLDVHETNSTWLGSLPHTWPDQTDAKNNGDHDKWLIAKPVHNHEHRGMPLTMGYYNREDLPFYYALADAFTVCDQNFCSSLTGTTPNRLYLWSGTLREKQSAESPANLRNEDVDYGVPAHWTTFPERLENAGVSWRIYQNELSIPSGLTAEQDAWLSSFGDNPLEWFPQFAVELAPLRRAYVEQLAASLPGEIKALKKQLNTVHDTDARLELEAKLKSTRSLLSETKAERHATKGKSLETLPEGNRNLHAKAFSTNTADPDYRTLTPLRYGDGDAARELQIPKGDVLHRFREDVAHSRLPAVSWIVAPEKFSDHPTAPWYGAWYVAEVMNILTQNPEVWKKTIFILTYDENDGFFDHVPPFGAPHPGKPETGAVSPGIDVGVEYVTLEQDRKRHSASKARGGSIGLGFRVPLLIASPWSRGGFVCSQIFDHTSVLQFLEQFATRRAGKQVSEPNITEWRRTVCGDLTSSFRPAGEEQHSRLPYPDKDQFIEGIYNARFKEPPPYQALSPDQIEQSRLSSAAAAWMSQAEPGIRPACALPYELSAAGRLSADRRALELTLAARNQRFGAESQGSPFHVYAPGGYLHEGASARTRSYAVKAGQELRDRWQLSGFANSRYRLQACGPNGFLVELAGTEDDPMLEVETIGPRHSAQELTVSLANTHAENAYTLLIAHYATGSKNVKSVGPGETATLSFDLQRTFGWYDFALRVEGFEGFERRYAGHVETGRASFSDPIMGGVKV